MGHAVGGRTAGVVLLVVAGVALVGIGLFAAGIVAGSSHEIEAVHPDPETDLAVQPGTTVFLEADGHKGWTEVEWRVRHNGTVVSDWSDTDGGAVQSGWPHATNHVHFDESGTWTVEARTPSDDDDDGSYKTVAWTYDVRDDATGPLDIAGETTPADTIYYDETAAFTVTASGGEGPYRAAWWLAHCDTIGQFDSFDDAATLAYTATEYEECSPSVRVMDARGIGVTDRSFVVNVTEAITITRIEGDTRGEVIATLDNEGVESHDVDVSLSVNGTDGWTDTATVTIGPGESATQRLAHDSDRDELEVRVHAETGKRTAVSNTTTVSYASDPGEPTPTATPAATPTDTPTATSTPTATATATTQPGTTTPTAAGEDAGTPTSEATAEPNGTTTAGGPSSSATSGSAEPGSWAPPEVSGVEEEAPGFGILAAIVALCGTVAIGRKYV